MKHVLTLGAAFLAGPLCAWAGADDAKEEVETAIQRLAASPNFAWVATMIEEADGKDPKLAETMEGQSTQDGWCLLAKPKTKRTDLAVLKGERLALHSSEGWRLIDVQGAPAGGNADKILARAQRFAAARAPIGEARLLLGRLPELKLQENGLYAGRISPQDVSILLEGIAAAGKKIPAFGEPPQMRVNFRIKEGVLASWELVAEGRLAKGKKNSAAEERLFSVAVDFKEVGTTRLEIPDEARRLLD